MCSLLQAQLRGGRSFVGRPPLLEDLSFPQRCKGCKGRKGCKGCKGGSWIHYAESQTPLQVWAFRVYVRLSLNVYPSVGLCLLRLRLQDSGQLGRKGTAKCTKVDLRRLDTGLSCPDSSAGRDTGARVASC